MLTLQNELKRSRLSGMGAAFLMLSLIAACGSGTDTGDTTAPSVSSTVPLGAAIDVALGGTIAVTFSEAMDPSTITSATVTLKQGTSAIAGTVAYSGVTATLDPTTRLDEGASYTATVTTGATDLAGNALARAHVWSFTTGTTSDTTAPVVSSTVPLGAAIGVALGGNIAVTFSEAMDPSTITNETLILEQGTSEIAGTAGYSGVTATFEPTNALDQNTAYTATVTTGAADLAGNPLSAPYVWSFTTGSTQDTTAPEVISTAPADGAVGVAANQGIRVSFSEAMSPSTLTTATFTVFAPGSASVPGTVTYAGTRATFMPLSDLALDTLFQATITTGAADLAGNTLSSNFEWSFTTSATSALGPDPVLLGMAGGFAILAKSGVDTVPASAVTGDIGVSPIDSTAMTGFSLAVDATNEFATSGQVTGRLYAADYASPTPANLTTAIGNMETAYTDAAGRVTPDFTELGAGEIGGETLVPGLYKWGTGVSISTDVTLNGGPNDVWIFQIAGDITQANGTRVTLSGGALPHNVFWQAFGQVMIGTTAHFEGVVLCQTAIILGTGASVNGRLLAQTAVTLDQNAVTQPSQ